MYESIPKEVKAQASFCLWRLENRNGRMTKLPYQRNGHRGNPADKSTFTDFVSACSVLQDYDGIGMGVFDGYSAVDIDHCVENGKLSELARDIVDTMNSYTEFSPSGNGIRIIFKVRNLVYDQTRYYVNNRNIGLEIYISGRTHKFVTLTGNALGEKDVAERNVQIMAILEKYMVKPTQPPTVPAATAAGSYLTDEDVVCKAMDSKQGIKFRDLWNGEIPAGKSHSEADLALCSIFAFWCGGDMDQIDRLFRQSGLMRDKWERDDYRMATLQKAVSTAKEFYKPIHAAPLYEFHALLPTLEKLDVVNTSRYRSGDIYKEYGTEEFTADFSPATEEWQFASVQFSKSKYRTVQYIRVYCDYGYNSGTVYFDDIQLVRNSLETSLSASDFVVESTGTSDDTDTGETDIAPSFTEAKDRFGNALTETTFTDGNFGTIYRSFKFNDDDDCMAGNDAGNNLIEETDARGHKTTYTVDSDTSRNEEVTDRLGNKTAYEYDDSGRTAKVTSKDSNGTELAHVSYAYDTFDNMTKIVRGDGMKYALAYNEFHNLESIGIEGKSEALIKYAYKNGNGRLKQMTYANGHTMKAVYNSIGQMVAEKWFESETTATSSAAAPVAYYKYVYDGDNNIVRSIDLCGKKEYNYEYEEGRIVRATEADIELNGEIVTSKVISNTIKYYYDTEGKMTKKVITPAGGSAQTIYYETNDDNTVVKFSAGGRTVTSHSKTDSFGRKVFDELQLGTDFVSRQFVYHAGKVTAEHKEKAKVKSSATTQLVSQIILSNGATLSYGYDAEERITSVVETYTVDETPVTNTTLYTYDALGQLLTETVNGEVVNTMKYDNYGNIVEKNGKAYTYGNTTWKDLLTGFDGKTIEYDAQGNPVKYLGHTLTWEKGRQLKSFDGNTYTYNAKGIRTSKTVNGIKHEYTLDGTKILREVWADNTLIPLYDNEDSVCGILYNNVPYYFIKNLQGDVIAIIDKNAETVARYSYDAWGVPNISSDSSDCQIATINPFRYRGYFYDEETKLYYLLSRYYNPALGRFINADSIEWLGTNERIIETNIFAYCKNDCVNLSDEVGFGGIDTLLSVLNSSIDILAKIIDMIGNSYNKERKALEKSVKLLTKKQSRQLSNIKSLQKETGKLSKRLGWIGYGITFLTLVIGFAASYSTGRNLATSLIELGIETFIALIEFGAGKLFEWIARFIPYVGFLIGLIAGWLISYLLSKFFNSRRVARITSKFKASVKNIKISLGNWVKYAVKSLNA